MTTSTTSKILRNSLFNVVRGVVALPIALFLIPFILGHIGIRNFGIWALVYGLVQSASLLDFGLTSSLTKYVAELNETKKFYRLNRLFNSAFLAYSVLGAFFFVCTYWLSRLIVVEFFKAEVGERERLTWLIILAAGIIFLQLISSVFLALLQGLQRMDLTNFSSLLVLLVHFTFTVIVLQLGFGLFMLVVAQGVAVATGLVANIILVRRAYPQFDWNPRSASFGAVRAILPLSFSIQCLSLQTILFYQFDKFALGAYFGPAYAGYYDIAARPLASLRNIPLTIVQPVMPAVSELQARNDRKLIGEIFFYSLKYVVVVAAPVFILIIFLSGPLLHLWLGDQKIENIHLITISLQLLAATYLINLLTVPGVHVALGLGHSGDIFRYSVIGGVLHPVLTLILISALGYVGAPLAILFATLVSAVYLYSRFYRTTEFPLYHFFALFLKPIGFACMFGFGAHLLVSHYPWFATRAHSGILVSLYFVAFSVAMLSIGYISRQELLYLRNFLVNFVRNYNWRLLSPAK